VQLRRVRVENIRSYERADLEFGSGTTLLSGDVGAGKTSLLYAIEMALFGVAEVNAAYLVRHGAPHAEVSVAFEGSGHRYEIFRRFRRLRRKGQETFEAERIRFTVDGAETSYSATELRQQVIDLLGFPDNPSPQAHSDLWRWAVYVPQERMRDILGARPQDRLETVRKALGVERYRIAADNAQELATDLRRSAAAWRAEADRLKHFDEEFERGTREAEELRVARLPLEQAVRDRSNDLAALRVRRGDLEEAVRKVDADERELTGLGREQDADRESLGAVQQGLKDRSEEIARRRAESAAANADAEALEPRRAALSTAEHALARARTQSEAIASALRSLAEARALLDAAGVRLASAHESAERARGEAAEATRAVDEAAGEGPAKEPPAPTPHPLSQIEERLAEARRRESVARSELTRAEHELHELDELLSGGVCPRCRQPVRAEEFTTHRREAAEAVATARGKSRSAEEERESLEAERAARERFERAHDRWKEVEKRRHVTRTALARSRIGLEAALAAEGTAERALASARERVEALAPAEATESALRAEVERLQAALATKTQEVERSVLASERRRGIDRALELLASEAERLERESAQLTGHLEERSRRMTSLRASGEATAQIRRDLAETERQLRAAEEALTVERSAVVRADARLDESVRRIAAAEAGRVERAELLREATETDEKAAWVGQSFRTAVLTMEQKLLTHAQALFEREFARYFASLVDDPGLVARTDPAFTPLVMIEGEWTPAEALSGGERTSLALAFRLALARVVRAMGSLHLDTVLLDEPTDGFSPEQVIRMGELLEELELPQVILVSHESQLSAIADRVVRVQKVDGRSTLVGAEGRGDGGNPPPAPSP
jgi:DNA repair protein SbcC/Rad50